MYEILILCEISSLIFIFVENKFTKFELKNKNLFVKNIM